MLSVMVIAKNEEANIERCLASLSFADEIIVLDSGSQDKTVAIASQFTDKVYSTDWQGYGVQKQRALEHCRGDWVLNLDADEWCDDAFRDEITRIIQEDQADAYRVPILTNFYGQTLHYANNAKRHIRLFKRLGVSYSKDWVHEFIKVPEHFRIAKMHSALHHHCYRDVSHVLQKINRYSSYTAKARIQKGRTATMSKTIAGSFWMFFRCYVLQKGFLDGRSGFLMACVKAHESFYRGVKLMYPDANLLQELTQGDGVSNTDFSSRESIPNKLQNAMFHCHPRAGGDPSLNTHDANAKIDPRLRGDDKD